MSANQGAGSRSVGGSDVTVGEFFKCHVPQIHRAAGPSSVQAGYFTFLGSVCYGHLVGFEPAVLAAGPLPEVGDAVEWRNGGLVLPFDLDEVVQNLRFERYRQSVSPVAERMTRVRLLRSAYYAIRPFLPVSVRRHLQRIRLAGWEQISFPRWPVDLSADRLVQHALRLVLEHSQVQRVHFIWFWPEGAPACGMMTHDIEGKVGRDFCPALMALDESFGIPAAFQIVPDGDAATPRSDLEQIRARGFEVNIHDLNHDGSLFEDRAHFGEKAATINQYARELECRGFRSGAMYREQDWFDAFEFAYDMSVPNAAHLEPQRGGCCTIMPYFVGKVLELPLTTTQDYSLFHILGDYSIDRWKAQVNLIVENHGLASFIAHPDYLLEPRARAVYTELLEHLAEARSTRNLWLAMPGEINDWWRARHAMTLAQDGAGWRIDGDRSGRARVAFASLEEGRLVYTVETEARCAAL